MNDKTDVIYAHIRLVLISLTVAGALAGFIIGVVISRSLTAQVANPAMLSILQEASPKAT
ncbi:hypothetical protein [Undibacterium sp.]|uniref:hypothetical protein n=1 Tax=Undibacterium sp. TaxID=1914977 RepID=UPI00351D4539